MDAVTLRHVDKAYTSYSTEIVITGEQRQSRTRQVLKDLSVTFAAGQLTVIVGRSGCGKSTLLKLLAGKEQPDAGEISIPQGWHSAMLSPDPYVITWTNVQRNVAMACGVGKTPEELNDYEATLLAGVPNAPSVYAPTKNPDKAEQRRLQVVNRMIACGYITVAESETYAALAADY